MFSVFEILLLAFIAFVFVFAIIDRICKCIEKRNAFAAIANMLDKKSLEEFEEACVRNNIL